jgi:excisionase family DNA binding protein
MPIPKITQPAMLMMPWANGGVTEGIAGAARRFIEFPRCVRLLACTQSCPRVNRTALHDESLHTHTLLCQAWPVGEADVMSLAEIWRRFEEHAYAGSPTLTVEQARELLGQDSVQTIYRWCRDGTIPAYRIGRSWIIYRDLLRDFMEAERAEREARATAEGTQPQE